jgi:hypothetical protein
MLADVCGLSRVCIVHLARLIKIDGSERPVALVARSEENLWQENLWQENLSTRPWLLPCS